MLLTLPLLLAASRDRSINRHAVAGDAHGRVWTNDEPCDDAATDTWRRDEAAPAARFRVEAVAWLVVRPDAPVRIARDGLANYSRSVAAGCQQQRQG